jgi:hypothetical protein
MGVLSGLLVGTEEALPVPPATRRDVWATDGNADQVSIRAISRRAHDDLGTPWPDPLAHAYARVFRAADGNRTEYEAAVDARQRRLSRAAVTAASTGEATWLDEVADGVTLLCEQSTWCWPSHDDTFTERGFVVPTVTDPYVDLGAGEVAAQLAWVDHLLAASLDERYPGLRERIRHEVGVRVMEPFRQRSDWHWLGLDGDVHNWNPWIHGNLLVAALRLVDDADARSLIVLRCIEGLDRYVASLPSDGAIDEGYDYWWNGACRLLEALDLLHHATRGALDARGSAAIREIVAFPHRMHLGGEWYLSIADAQARSDIGKPWHLLDRAARLADDQDARRHAAAHRQPDTPAANEMFGFGRLLFALTDTAWTSAATTTPPLLREVWFASTQVLVARQAAGSADGLAVAVKGGHNGEHHNHNDVGGVVVTHAGVPVVIDVGRPTYTAETFGPNRYASWTMQSSWHSVPEIRGTAQSPGPSFTARDVEIDIRDTRVSIGLDLADAYPRQDIRSWRRHVVLDRIDGRVIVSEAWHLDPEPSAAPTCLHFMLAGDVDLRSDHAVVHTLGGTGSVRLTWPRPPVVHARIQERPLDDPMLSSVWGDHVTRLALELGSDHQGSIQVLVEEEL